MGETKIFLNTWGAYNNGEIGYGWMTPQEALDFIEENSEKDGGEFFIADINNYTGVDFGTVEYASINEVCEVIMTLNDMAEWERKEIVALMEYEGSYSVKEAIDNKDDYIFYSDIDEYHYSCDELLDFRGCNDIIERYFDYDAYHSDCDFDIYEASNGVCVFR